MQQCMHKQITKCMNRTLYMVLAVIKKYLRAWLFGYCIIDQMCNDCGHDYNEDIMKLKLDKK